MSRRAALVAIVLLIAGCATVFEVTAKRCRVVAEQCECRSSEPVPCE